MTLSALFIGNESLAVQCAEIWRARGHSIAAIATRNAEVRAWAQSHGLRVEPQGPGLTDRLADTRYDWVLSIANLSLVPEAVLTRASAGAVNFHDGPLPRHAGLNAPVWAILDGEADHGITWHRIEGGIDEGRILEQRRFAIATGETALTLNTKCFEAAIDSFPALVTALETGAPGSPQDLSQRSYHGRDDRPRAAARLDFALPQARLLALVNALDHGGYANPLARPKLETASRVLVVGAAEPAPGMGAPGQVLAVDEAGLTVACKDGAVTLRGLRGLDGATVCPKTVAVAGDVLPPLTGAQAARIEAALAAITPGETAVRKALRGFAGTEVPMARPAGVPDWRALPLAGLDVARVAAWACRMVGASHADVALHDHRLPQAPGYVTPWAPLRLGEGPVAALDMAARYPGFAADLPLRDPALAPVAMPQIVLAPGADAPMAGSVITLTDRSFHYDAARLDPAFATLLHARLIHAQDTLPDDERRLTVEDWNATTTDFADTPIHRLFEAQAARTPDAPALVHEGTTLSYAQLNAAANRAAHVLRAMGVAPGTLVGLATRRSPLLLVGALAILKAGGAYVPMDPAYPADRIALYLNDSGAPVVVSETSVTLPGAAARLDLDTDPRLDLAPTGNPEGGAGPGDLAYMIYTSGSTGRPKGVMVEHRNVANFFVGMDARIGAEPGTWLAVTSLSFDISVLELFWTLSRGFKLVLMGDADRALVSNGAAVSARGMDFSLYYWGNDDGVGPAKYELLLEGARFADTHGFKAVWTPERHFHAFGGPYPNPSVTGAAVAAITKNIEVRAGSCVAPLHHPARIAEEWAVIDNLTNGRTALGIASGWHPEDFVLRPENAPPHNKAALFDTIDKLRRLWRGEAVAFPMAGGKMVDIVTQPRPVSRELTLWVTIAGNPDTWREAGEIGANVLTHLLGQSIEELEGKIAIYHKALREGGRDPANHTVTLMLHTFVARDREAARRIAREPMKTYLRSAAGLVKQYAWAFPAFKRPQGVANPSDIDLRTLSPDETEAILDFAFHRYFEDSGLFGTVDDCLARVEQLKRLGIGEIACLIDYGIAKETVLEGLYPLAEVLRRANARATLADTDYSIAAQITRHKVTHLQCTPSLARMIALNDEARGALRAVKTLMIGGEALPGALVADLKRATSARVLNMYGPTETTIWSTTETARDGETTVNIGTPIANTQVYVLDLAMQPCPVGAPGELWIGGAGVTRGYWQRPDLTAERFVPNPFHPGRMYRTGDLVRWRADGRLDFLGRADHQVKLRGYRIELGEIEAVAERCAGVRQAVVISREDIPGDVRLVAYVTGDSWLSVDALRAHIATHLPEHMVPSHVVKLGEFPLTPNRKIDRKALPAPLATATLPDAFEPPAAGAEATIAAVWQRVLNLPSVGARDNFFALGGHSLLAVQAHREIRAALGTTKLSITDIFRFPTLAALAAHLDEGGVRPEVGADPADAADRAAQRAEAMSARRALRARRGA